MWIRNQIENIFQHRIASSLPIVADFRTLELTPVIIDYGGWFEISGHSISS